MKKSPDDADPRKCSASIETTSGAIISFSNLTKEEVMNLSRLITYYLDPDKSNIEIKKYGWKESL